MCFIDVDKRQEIDWINQAARVEVADAEAFVVGEAACLQHHIAAKDEPVRPIDLAVVIQIT